ncbi:uncharacterized protein PFL1_06394 [Pseudozyma flocculosa PF-1]|uniref:Wax synthase domain-containing protein n=1 Tax=Pseudozyma flocculosa PF-1 TaxID=1277687 RepID=A0A061H1F4_9BASI|nr:uncharacterized protein PFL1_06394 [Pseudozyma flocculosa PF-1]EPQ25939.1 hypothetical protein PFL1_06394 [Pseudozyma flocculosa PF-1]
MSTTTTTATTLALPHILFILYLVLPPLNDAVERSTATRWTYTSILLALHALGLVILYHLSPAAAASASASTSPGLYDGQRGEPGWPEKRALLNIAIFAVANQNVVTVFRILRHVARLGGPRASPCSVGMPAWKRITTPTTGNERERQEEVPKRFGLERIRWAADGWMSLRGVGWKWGCAHRRSWPTWPDAVVRGGRSKWIGYNLVRLARNLLILDLLNTLSQTRASLHTSCIRCQPLPALVLDTFLAGAQGVFALTTSYLVLSLVCVTLGLGTPQDWRPLFGAPRHAPLSKGGRRGADWTHFLGDLERFWARFWHGLFRDSFVGLPRGLVDLVVVGPPCATAIGTVNGRAPSSAPKEDDDDDDKTRPRARAPRQRSHGETLLTSLLAFTLSALLHSLPNYIMLHRLPLGSAAFFLVQPLGIALERLALKPLGLVRSDAWSGIAWVLLWFAATGALLMDEYVEAGFWYIDMVPHSLVRPLLETVTGYRFTKRDDWM